MKNLWKKFKNLFKVKDKFDWKKYDEDKIVNDKLFAQFTQARQDYPILNGMQFISRSMQISSDPNKDKLHNMEGATLTFLAFTNIEASTNKHYWFLNGKMLDCSTQKEFEKLKKLQALL